MKIVRSGGRGLLLASAVVALFAPDARAELLRCKGPDGKTIYTDKPALCPGAAPFEPSGSVQKAPGSSAPAAPSVPGVPSVPGQQTRQERQGLRQAADKARAAQWAAKKRAAEEELEQVIARRDHLTGFIAHCNRGGYVTTRDEAGIKDVVSCNALKRDFAALEQREAQLKSYLRDGLKEECRRAGCLPGWIR